MKYDWQRIKQWFDNNIDRWPDFLGALMLGFGLIVFISEYFGWSALYIPVLSDLFLRIWPELIGIGLAVIIIDNANEMLRTREQKNQLILQMGSPEHAFAIEAVRQLRTRCWVTDGSLRGAYLASANLEGANLSEANLVGVILPLANLMNANLEEANLSEASLVGAKLTLATLMDANLEEANMAGANLKQAYLRGANLNRAVLSQANLEGAILDRADLRDTNLREVNMAGAYLSEANLKGAEVKPEQLAETKSLEGATMPDGTKYEGENTEENQEEQ